MNKETELAYYAAVFAADAGTDALYYERYTGDMARLCISVSQEVIKRGEAASRDNRRFHWLVFVEGAANALNQCHAATLEQMFDAGQMATDSIGGEGVGR